MWCRDRGRLRRRRSLQSRTSQVRTLNLRRYRARHHIPLIPPHVLPRLHRLHRLHRLRARGQRGVQRRERGIHLLSSDLGWGGRNRLVDTSGLAWGLTLGLQRHRLETSRRTRRRRLGKERLRPWTHRQPGNLALLPFLAFRRLGSHKNVLHLLRFDFPRHPIRVRARRWWRHSRRLNRSRREIRRRGRRNRHGRCD